MSFENVSTNSYDILYQKILEMLGIVNLTQEGYNLSEVGFLQFSDLANANEAVSNENLYYLCNNTPLLSSSYVPNGDLITSYALFLNNLSPASKQSKTNGVISISEAKNVVSFLTGARNRSVKNNYNMPVNSIPISGKDSYLPYYKLMGLKEALPIWEENQNQSKYPYNISVLGVLENGNKVDGGIELAIEDYSKLKLSSPVLTKKTENSNDESLEFSVYEIHAKFSGLGNFKVAPVNWFFPSFFKNKAYSLLPNSPDFFGINGSLSAVVTSLLLGYNLEVKIMLTEESFKNFSDVISKISKSTKASISVGKLNFDISGVDKNTRIEKVKEQNTMYLTPIDIHLPNLLGVISKSTQDYIQGNQPFYK